MAIAAGRGHSVALKRDGTVVAWGHNEDFETEVPLGLNGLAFAIAAGSRHTVALKTSYDFGGFLWPVNAPPTVNTLEAGAAVRVKFSLGDNKGLAILAPGSPLSRTVSCRSDAITDEVEHTVPGSSSSLRYDASTDTCI